MFLPDGIVCCFFVFSSSCQTLLCFGQTVLFVVLLFSLVVVSRGSTDMCFSGPMPIPIITDQVDR